SGSPPRRPTRSGVPRHAWATRVAGCSATAPSPTWRCNRNSGTPDSTAGSLVRPGLGGVAAWPSAGSDRYSGPTPTTTCSITFTGPMPMTAFCRMPSMMSTMASTVSSPISGAYGYRPYADPNGYYAGRSARRGVSSGRCAATTNGPGRRAAEVCSTQAPELTDWPIERISEVVQPTDAQRPPLDELRAASAKAIEMLQFACPKDLPSIPTGRLAAMESRLQVMLAAVQTVRPPLDPFSQSLSDEQKARFNAIAPTDDPAAAGKDQRDLAKFCDEKSPGVTDLPIDRIGQAVQPTPAQQAALDELKNAS